ncbi:MAG: transglycosylase domain-containing protein, partial [Acidimicrobiia bacterium]|nr:transglycosylase domain-containing protein [Acidimicrobiia bacterium]
MAERITWSDRLAQVISTVLRLSTATLVALVVVPPATLGVAVATLIYGPLPVGKLPDEKPAITAEPSTVVDANGDEIAVFRRFDRTVPVTWDDIPTSVRQAVVAIEDQRFWQHNGIDYEGIGRAARTNLALGEVAQGGSTITQQYVKNVYLSREQTIERKVEEALLAIEVEKRMTKEEILFGYLTSSYFGDGAYGIGAAAEVYFGKPVSQLDISESATLAGLVQAPTRLSPRNDLDAAESRRVLVLQAMMDQGYLTLDQFETEAARRLWPADSESPATGPVTLVAPRPVKGAIRFPYFVDWVETTLVDQLGPDLVYTGGLRIETTIDPRLQGAAERAVATRLERTKYPVDMALVSLEPATGHVVAMVGGRDYAFSQVNLATGGTTGFQPGSSFKPFVLATALSQGMSPDTKYPAPGSWRVPGCQGECTISNYDGVGHGNIPLREAMRASVNTVFAKLVVDVGVDNTVALARSLGLNRLDPNRNYGASLA